MSSDESTSCALPRVRGEKVKTQPNPTYLRPDHPAIFAERDAQPPQLLLVLGRAVLEHELVGRVADGVSVVHTDERLVQCGGRVDPE